MIRWYLLPFSFLYAIIIYIRNRMFDNGLLSSHEFDVPVICVGNITVGGTGKTPHVEYLVKQVSQKFKTAVLSRGYKRKTKGFILASDLSTSLEIGDEPLQIRKKIPGTTVAVDSNRVNGINQLLKALNHPVPEVIILDDAFQHRYVKPGLSILLIDYNQPMSSDFMLPAGRLRDQVSEKRRAQIIILSKCPPDMKPIDRRIIVTDLKPLAYQRIFFTTYKYGLLTPVFKENHPAPPREMESVRNFHILLITGIAKTESLLKYIQTFSSDIDHLKYSDHHAFSTKNINAVVNAYHQIRQPNCIIITTEKDAIRLREIDDVVPLLSLPLFYLPVEVDFLYSDQDEFDKMIFHYINNCDPIEIKIKKSRK